MTMADDYGEPYNDDDYLEVSEALQFGRFLLHRLGDKELTDQELRTIFESFLAAMARGEFTDERES